jgi:AcrR family transcriptional regulator
MSRGGLGTKGMARDDRQQMILGAAIAEFAAHGFVKASMAAIAARSGISKALVYQHFEAKDNLYLACLGGIAEPLISRIEAEMDAAPTPFAMPLSVLRGMFESLGSQRESWKVLYDPTAPLDGPVGEVVRAHRDRLVALSSRGAAEFLCAKGDTDPSDIEALGRVWTNVVDAIMAWAIEHPEETVDELAARCARIIGAVFTAGRTT